MGLFSRNIELLDFQRGARHWYYAIGNRDAVVGGATYLPSALQRGGISESTDLTRNTLDLTAPQDLPFLDQFRGTAPMQPIDVVLRKQKVSDGSIATLWQGTLGGVTWSTHDAKIHCLPPMASLQALALKRCWQVGCPHVLYGAGDGQCNASRAAVQASAAITAVSGNVVHAAAFAAQADGWWAGGYFTWQNGETTEVRFITDHAGDAVTLMTPALMEVGIVVDALPGCNHTMATCASKFTSSNPADTNGNSANYGGQPGIPKKNPFGVDSIY
jgi:uncharacterized phage protein (TIGR02218 family)